MHRPTPMTCTEWADENYYLSAESAYIEGRWQTLPVQRAILNSFGNDEIRVVNLVKSARIGYSQMLKAAAGYLIEHKKRNGMILQPTDAAANSFMKAHIETALRDVPVLKALSPWLGKKHRNNTLEGKLFSNCRNLWCLGGTSAKNYREKSLDFIIYDELSAFPDDIEKEGAPTFLGDKRLEGAAYPKSIRGSTPKIKDLCQIERAANESEVELYFYVPCPHCKKKQTLKWGGKCDKFGFKWETGKPDTVYYLCERSGCKIKQHEIQASFDTGTWRCKKTGIQTTDGLEYLDKNNKTVETPESVTWHIWTAYSPFTTWSRIVKDFLNAKSDTGKLKSFVNTTLGETWEENTGTKIDQNMLYSRREYFPVYDGKVVVPNGVVYITIGGDTQDDRFEWEVVGWGANEESWSLDYKSLYGNLTQPEIWKALAEALQKTYTREDGAVMNAGLVCWDSGGHFTDEVYALSKKMGVRWFIPTKGASQAGKPVVEFPRQRNKKGVYLSFIGTDNAKEIIYQRLSIMPERQGVAASGCCHWPINDETHGESYFNQLTAERKTLKFIGGRRVYTYICPKGKRNEALDCRVGAFVAMRIARQYMGINLDRLAEEQKHNIDNKKDKALPGIEDFGRMLGR
ncbi:MAG: terminase gpA endonuclease subunit [Parvularculales bacterium]